MSEQTNAQQPAAANKLKETAAKATHVRLKIKRSSRFIPILTLLFSLVLFVAYALPSGNEQFARELGIEHSGDKPLTFDALHDKWNSDPTLRERVNKRLLAETNEAGEPRQFWDYVGGFYQVGRPLAKIYLDQLFGKDFPNIFWSVLNTIWQLSLFSLIPGLAGLIYRRNFLTWFLVSFTILLGINASGIFGSLTIGEEPMPESGAFFFFIASQIAILLLAFRLRRHAQGSELLPPKWHNRLLKAVLVFVGIACVMGWGPGYRSGNAKEMAQNSLPTERQFVVTPAAAQDAASDAASPAATDDLPSAPSTSEPAPGAPVEATRTESQATTETENSSDASGYRPSWIWGFLGDGLISRWFYTAEFLFLGLPLIYTLFRNSSPWPARKGKYIVICLDGTSNTPDQIERGFAAQTNVYKLFKMLKSDEPAHEPSGEFDASLCKKFGERQIGLYYAGVGNKYDQNPLLQVFGLATGMGADEIVERAYLDLIRVYRPGDRIVITGFSRGAAIARLLSRAIDARGAPRSVWTLFLFGKHRKLKMSSEKNPVPITVLGCWDTVGAFGVAKTIFGINFQQLNMGKDLSVPDNVEQAYHMVALDERRDSFEPTLMDPDPIRPERIVEVWFPGDHANIGGGWATDGLSDITLDFLLQRLSSGYAKSDMATPGADDWGVYLAARKADKVEVAHRAETDAGNLEIVDPDHSGQVRAWFSRLYEYRPRTLPLHAVISGTVFQRMSEVRPAYAPEALFKLNEALDAHRDAVVSGIEKFSETQSLTEDERNKVLKANECLRLLRWPNYWADVRKKVRRRLDERDQLTGHSMQPANPALENQRLDAVDQVLNPERILSNAVLA